MDKQNISIEEYLYLVHDIAGKMAKRLPQDIPKEELTGAGVIGLHDAKDKFNPKTGVKFRSYAKIRIKGAILDELRKMDFVPRTFRRDAKRIENASHALVQKLKREPHDYEIAEQLEIEDIEKYHKLAARVESPTSFNIDDLRLMPRPLFRESLEKLSTSETHERLMKKELINFLKDSISKLTEREQKVLSLYYHDELAHKEIAYIFRRTENRIRQIHSKAKLKLEKKLKNYYK